MKATPTSAALSEAFGMATANNLDVLVVVANEDRAVHFRSAIIGMAAITETPYQTDCNQLIFNGIGNGILRIYTAAQFSVKARQGMADKVIVCNGISGIGPILVSAKVAERHPAKKLSKRFKQEELINALGEKNETMVFIAQQKDAPSAMVDVRGNSLTALGMLTKIKKIMEDTNQDKGAIDLLIV